MTGFVGESGAIGLREEERGRQRVTVKTRRRIDRGGTPGGDTGQRDRQLIGPLVRATTQRGGVASRQPGGGVTRKVFVDRERFRVPIRQRHGDLSVTGPQREVHLGPNPIQSFEVTSDVFGIRFVGPRENFEMGRLNDCEAGRAPGQEFRRNPPPPDRHLDLVVLRQREQATDRNRSGIVVMGTPHGEIFSPIVIRSVEDSLMATASVGSTPLRLIEASGSAAPPFDAPLSDGSGR